MLTPGVNYDLSPLFEPLFFFFYLFIFYFILVEIEYVKKLEMSNSYS